LRARKLSIGKGDKDILTSEDLLEPKGMSYSIIFMSIGHVGAKCYPQWIAAFVAFSIKLISGQATAVMSGAGW
jgi:hypothetical protein